MFVLVLLLPFFGFGILQAQLQPEVRNSKTAIYDVDNKREDEAENYYYSMTFFINLTRFSAI